jgi:type IV pilus assembly protein PilA
MNLLQPFWYFRTLSHGIGISLAHSSGVLWHYTYSQGDYMKKQKGFSLIELLIVVAIILIIAAIAIPNLMRSRMAANESSAVGSVRTINTSMVAYAAAFPDTGYAATLVALGGAIGGCAPGTVATIAAACLIDPTLAAGAKSGYNFAAAGAAVGATVNNVYTVTAVPQGVGSTGNRGFYSDQSGVIRYSLTGVAPTTASSPLQ